MGDRQRGHVASLGGSLVARFGTTRADGRHRRRLLVRRQLFLAFAYTHSFRLALYLLVLAVGALVGPGDSAVDADPRKAACKFRDLVSHVLTFDYLGALTLLRWRSRSGWCRNSGWSRSAFLFGMINAASPVVDVPVPATSCRRD